MALRPQRLPGFAAVNFRWLACFDCFEIDQYPRPGRDVFKVRPRFDEHDLFRINDFANNVVGMPSRKHDKLLGIVVQTGLCDLCKPIPRGRPDYRAIRFGRILVQIIVNHNVNRL